MYKGLLDALAAPSLQMHKVEFTRVIQRRNAKKKQSSHRTGTHLSFHQSAETLFNTQSIQQKVQKDHGSVVGQNQVYSKRYYRPALINLQEKPQKEQANPK